MTIADKIAEVHGQVEAAARKRGCDPQDIALMAVTKGFPAEAIRQAYEAGVRLFGESRVQEFSGKSVGLESLSNVRWHLIGHLQSNKARRAVELFDAIDSLDSARLARKLDQAARAIQKRLAVLVEINIAGEEAKSGVLAESEACEELLALAPELTCLEFLGLMTIPPYLDDPETSRPYFRKMRELFNRIAQRNLPAVHMKILSMGMSHDFQVAIEEGATCVRIGTAIFGERSSPRSDG